MKQERDYIDYLEDILAAAQKARSFVDQMKYEDFVKDDKTAFAVFRALEIIGRGRKAYTASGTREISSGSMAFHRWNA